MCLVHSLIRNLPGYIINDSLLLIALCLSAYSINIDNVIFLIMLIILLIAATLSYNPCITLEYLSSIVRFTFKLSLNIITEPSLMCLVLM